MTRYLLSAIGLAAACNGSVKEDDSNVTPLKLEAQECRPGQDCDLLVDSDPSDDVFAVALAARPASIDVAGEPVELLTYGGWFPGPDIRVKQGDRVVIQLQNDLPSDFPTTIHWHGIEGTNGSDGTPTTQLPIEPGASFTYDFVVPRPGIYWYHPHIRGAQSTHSGLYGTLIVEDPDEGRLEEMGVLPKLKQTMVLSDLGVFQGAPIRVEGIDDMALMNGTEGVNLLVNGATRPVYDVPEGQGIRLQMVNTSITRYWRLVVPGHDLMRVGGQTGLLEHVRLEGGMLAAKGGDGSAVEVDSGFGHGELLLAPAERADVVLIPKGSAGDEVVLRWEDFARGRHGMRMVDGEMVMGDALDDGTRAGVEVAAFRLVESKGGEAYSLVEGDDVLAAVGRSVAPIEMGANPVEFVGEQRTELSERMEMTELANGDWAHEADFYMDEMSWMPGESGMMGPDQPLAPTAKSARIGDRIVWEVRNDTRMAHPFHLHGFAYQPVSFSGGGMVEDHDGEMVDAGEPWQRTVDTVEFADTTHIPAYSSMFFHVAIDDFNGNGGSAGRWMMHCHIFQHAEQGMMSELVVTP